METNKARKRVRFVGMGPSKHLTPNNLIGANTIASGSEKNDVGLYLVSVEQISKQNIDFQFLPNFLRKAENYNCCNFVFLFLCRCRSVYPGKRLR